MAQTQTRRPRAATPEKRRRILDAAELIMLGDGYAAVTSRRLESETGLKVHYHFGSIDELFIAIVRRRGERNVARLADALDTILAEYGIDRQEFPPALVAAAMQGLAFAMAYDQVAGFDTAQAEAADGMDRLLIRLEARRSAARAP